MVAGVAVASTLRGGVANEKCIWTICQRPSRFSSTPV